MEAGLGSCFVGARTLVAMKHVGLNVASDALMTLTYTGVKGGYVLIVADDPGMHSSQNEQDTRHYARFAKIPLLEPSDSQEAKDMVGQALEMSEVFDTPIIIRITTRVAHGESIVTIGKRKENTKPLKFEKDNSKYVMIPAFARKRHTIVESRLLKLKEYSEQSDLNQVELYSREMGIITSGINYEYCKEIYPDASFLKLGMPWPLPDKKILDFSQKVKKLYVIEDLDRFLEENIKLLGIKVIAKPDKMIEGELDCDKISEIITGQEIVANIDTTVPPRPPVMCAGCPHRPIYWITNKLNLIVDGDIGCYTLGTLPPLDALHTTICMGASIGMMHGMRKVLAPKDAKNVVSVIGDSTFFHTGINNLISTLYNNGTGVLLLLDNRITAMTGGQQNPGTGFTIKGEKAFQIDIEKLCTGLGVKNITKVDSYDLKAIETAIKEAVNRENEYNIVISTRPCVLIVEPETPFVVAEETCRACGACLRSGCPALIKQENGKIKIDGYLCNGCSLCAQICPFKAISQKKI
jgi:indolepyruvate ferredoxin oxidoreductase alpha subunit